MSELIMIISTRLLETENGAITLMALAIALLSLAITGVTIYFRFVIKGLKEDSDDRIDDLKEALNAFIIYQKGHHGNGGKNSEYDKLKLAMARLEGQQNNRLEQAVDEMNKVVNLLTERAKR